MKVVIEVDIEADDQEDLPTGREVLDHIESQLHIDFGHVADTWEIVDMRLGPIQE